MSPAGIVPVPASASTSLAQADVLGSAATVPVPAPVNAAVYGLPFVSTTVSAPPAPRVAWNTPLVLIASTSFEAIESAVSPGTAP